MRQLIYIFLLTTVLFSCNEKPNYKIYNLIINKESNYPEIHPNGILNVDSLNLARNKNIILGINRHFYEPEVSRKDKFPKEFMFFFDESLYELSKDSIVDLSKIDLLQTKKIRLINEKPNYSNLDIYLVCSKIVFNKASNKAVVECSKSYGKLSGGGMYYLLEKVKGKWFIKKVISTWVS